MIRMTGPSILLLVGSMLGGCNESVCLEIDALPGGPLDPTATEPSYLAVGDSILYMNGPMCMGIPARTALELGLYVEDLSYGGRPLTDPVYGQDIMHQFTSGAWEWVIMTGGGNDLVQECGCRSEVHNPENCEDVLDSLAAPEEREGDIFAFIDRVRQEGGNPSTLILGYYELPENSAENSDLCNPYILELTHRYRQVAGQEEGVFFLDTEEVMDFESFPEHFSLDWLHPSLEGSSELGTRIAEFIGSH